MKHGTRLALAMVLFLLLAPPILAQETPTDAPTNIPPATATFTETPIPTETPTYTAIPTQTPTETATVTETPSETPSETPTTTVVETPTETVVETPIETATTISSETATETPTETSTAELTTSATLTETAIAIETTTLEPSPTPPYADGLVEQEVAAFALLAQDPVLRIIPASDMEALEEAITAVNDGEVSIIYLRGGIYTSSERLHITGTTTIYGNDAELQLALGMDVSGTVELHNLKITGANGSFGYGGALGNSGILSIYDSEISNNFAMYGGGGIYNTNELSITRTAFIFNHAGGGGALQNDGSGHATIECSVFIDNHAGYGGAILNGDVNNDMSSITIHNSSFGVNVANSGNGDDIYNLVYQVSQVAQIDATGNWWHSQQNPNLPDGSSRTPDVGPVGGVDAAAALDYNPTRPVPPNPPAISYYRDAPCVPVAARDVADEAILFHLRAQEYGLPIPFDSLPYNVNQPDQDCDPLGWFRDVSEFNCPYPQITQQVQGFGPSSFAFSDPDLYGQTYQIHSGVDYGAQGSPWEERVVVSLCDGVVIAGNNITGSFENGGSAAPGRGVSVRCFMDSLDSPGISTNGDELPNLSNIVITYNHLLWQPDDKFNFSNPPHRIECGYVTNFVTCTGLYDLPRIGDIVRVGTPLGQTGWVDPDLNPLDHLHLAIFLARGFHRDFPPGPGTDKNAFYLNPMLMYTSAINDAHKFQVYFPTDIFTFEIVPDPLGINEEELNSWSAGGWNSDPNGNDSGNTFWAVQTPIPEPPNHVEWPFDNYPSVSRNDPMLITELIEYLDQSFAQFPYVAPNCTLSTDDTRTPPRQIADAACYDSPDLYDDTPYSPVPHPAP